MSADVSEAVAWTGSKRQKDALRLKFGGRCAYCGETLTAMHCDHLEPVIRYNPSAWDTSAPKGVQMVKPERNTVANMMPACKGCNLHKGGYPLEGWRDILQRSAEIVGKQTSTFRAAVRMGVISVSSEPVTFYFERLAAQPNQPRDREGLREALEKARWYVNDHMEAQPNDETKADLAAIDAALGAK